MATQSESDSCQFPSTISHADSRWSLSEVSNASQSCASSGEISCIDAVEEYRQRGVSTVSFDVISSCCDMIGKFFQHEVATCRLVPVNSPFDALTEPKISIPCYFERLRQYSVATSESMLCAIVLVRRVVQNHSLALTPFNCHRLLVTAIMVFAKFYDDTIDSNARWARIAGVKKSEMNNLEVELLNRLYFDLRVNPEEFYTIVHEISHFSSAPASPMNSPTYPLNSRGIVTGFHVLNKKAGDVQRTQSSGEDVQHVHPPQQPHHSHHSHSHRSIKSFFHISNHAHLNGFSHQCSPSSSIQSPAGSESASPASTLSRGSRPSTLPRGISLQHITAMLHSASPFVHNNKQRSSKEKDQGLSSRNYSSNEVVF